MIRVFVTDDHELMREGIKKVLKEEPDIRVTGEARTATQTISSLRLGIFDVIILDLTLPDRSGLDILKEVKSLGGEPAILILSMHPEERFAERALAAGADGYLTKEAVSRDLVNAIRTVAAGRKFISPRLAALLASRLGEVEHQAPHKLLSDREFEVFLRIAAGETVTMISEACSLSLSTVYTYRNRIFMKTGLRSDSDIVRYAMRMDLLS
jgi:two-component system, NarL family, invasion response regulator UvrY